MDAARPGPPPRSPRLLRPGTPRGPSTSAASARASRADSAGPGPSSLAASGPTTTCGPPRAPSHELEVTGSAPAGLSSQNDSRPSLPRPRPSSPRSLLTRLSSAASSAASGSFALSSFSSSATGGSAIWLERDGTGAAAAPKEPACATAAAVADAVKLKSVERVPDGGLCGPPPLYDDPTRARLAYSWSCVSANIELNGVRLMARLLQLAPAVLNTFSFADEAPLEASTALRRHGVAVLRAVGEVVAAGNDARAKEVTLASVGKRHFSKYLVEPEAFAAIAEAVVWTAETALGRHWEDDLLAGWVEGAKRVVTIMQVHYPVIEADDGYAYRNASDG